MNTEAVGYMLIYWALSMLVPAFVITKIVLFFYSDMMYYQLQIIQFCSIGKESRMNDFDNLAAISMVSHLMMLVHSIICFRNFGKGLKNKQYIQAKLNAIEERVSYYVNADPNDFSNDDRLTLMRP